MRRRSILAGAGVVLSTTLGGCSGTGTDDDPEAGEGAGTDGLRITGVDTEPPPDGSVSPAVSVANGEGTAETPAGVSVGWRNESDGPLRLGEERSIFFQTARSDDGSARLLGEEWRDREETVSFDGCWYVSGDIVVDGEYRTVELEPGETVEAESGLYTDSSDCLTGGEYRFSTTVTGEAPAGSEERQFTGEWGLALDVETGD